MFLVVVGFIVVVAADDVYLVVVVIVTGVSRSMNSAYSLDGNWGDRFGSDGRSTVSPATTGKILRS